MISLQRLVLITMIRLDVAEHRPVDNGDAEGPVCSL